METQTYNSIGTLPNSFADEIVVQILDRTIRCAELILSRLPIFQVLKHFILWMAILFMVSWLRLLGFSCCVVSILCTGPRSRFLCRPSAVVKSPWLCLRLDRLLLLDVAVLLLFLL